MMLFLKMENMAGKDFDESLAKFELILGK